MAAKDQRNHISDPHFKENMAWVTPQLRAFARSLSGGDGADDLVQDTLLKMWKARGSFEAGTNFRAWAFTILRNNFYSQVRRAKFVGHWDDSLADRELVTAPSQQTSIWLADVVRALQELPAPQREALVLVGAGGVSYEDAARIMGVAVGTVKSRVNRARLALDEILESGILATSRHDFSHADDVVRDLASSVEAIRRRPPSADAPQPEIAMYMAL